MQKVIDAIYEEVDELYNTADVIQGSWMRSIAERELNRNYTDIANRESTNYELRIEFTGISFRIRWIEYQFVKRGSKTIRVTRNVSMPESGKYKMSQFKKADEWELIIIGHIETAVAPIRYKLKHLGKAHNSIVWASKQDKRNQLQVREIKDRVERKVRSIKSIKESLRK